MQNRNRNNDHIRVAFRTVLQASLAAGVSTTPLSPNSSFGSRLLAEADAWSLFRVNALRFRLHPGGGQNQAAGYSAGIADTPPATIANVVELLASTFQKSQTTVPSSWVNVAKADLRGANPWYKSIAGTQDNWDEFPGYLSVCGTTTDPYVLEIEGEFEFRGAIAIGNTPAMVRARDERLARAREEERHRLLRVLAPVTKVVAALP